MATDYRSPDRESGYLFRMTSDEKKKLKAEAEEHGLTVQQLMELRVLGAAKPRRRSGPQPRTQEALDIAV